jgi:hypothetical protein
MGAVGAVEVNVTIDGQALEGASVTLWLLTSPPVFGHPRRLLMAEQASDSGGVVRFQVDHVGQYVARAEHWLGVPRAVESRGLLLATTEGSGPFRVSLPLKSAAVDQSVAGRVTSESGQALPNVFVVGPDGYARTDSLGRFELPTRDASQLLYVTVQRVDGRPFAYFAEVPGRFENLILPEPNCRVAGRTVGVDGTPRAGVRVVLPRALPAREDGLRRAFAKGFEDEVVISDADGTFRFERLYPGTYTVDTLDQLSVPIEAANVDNGNPNATVTLVVEDTSPRIEGHIRFSDGSGWPERLQASLVHEFETEGGGTLTSAIWSMGNWRLQRDADRLRVVVASHGKTLLLLDGPDIEPKHVYLTPANTSFTVTVTRIESADAGSARAILRLHDSVEHRDLTAQLILGRPASGGPVLRWEQTGALLILDGLPDESVDFLIPAVTATDSHGRLVRYAPVLVRGVTPQEIREATPTAVPLTRLARVVKGQVLDAETGAGLSLVSVELLPAAQDEGHPLLSAEGVGRQIIGWSSRGEFEVPLPVERCRIRLHRADMLPVELDVPASGGRPSVRLEPDKRVARLRVFSATAIDAETGQTVADAEWSLRHESGVGIDESGPHVAVVLPWKSARLSLRARDYELLQTDIVAGEDQRFQLRRSRR